MLVPRSGVYMEAYGKVKIVILHKSIRPIEPFELRVEFILVNTCTCTGGVFTSWKLYAVGSLQLP